LGITGVVGRFVRYVELHCKTNFSFLRGASHPGELVERAAELGYAGLAITDQTSLAGVVRAWGAAKEFDLKLLIGTEVAPVDGPPLVLWAMDRAGYGRMCRLISRARMRCEKGAAEVWWGDVAEFSEGLLAGVLPGLGNADESALKQQHLARDVFGDRAYLLCELSFGVDDQQRLDQLLGLAKKLGIPPVAAGDVHYHVAERMLLHDCVTAIRLGQTIDEVHASRFANSQRHLRSLGRIANVFQAVPELIDRTGEVADRCSFRLDELRYEYPEELAPEGRTPIEHLKRLTWEGAKQRWPGGVPESIIEGLRHELKLIEELHYEAYFLTVWDMVRFARERNILCQGRGSAANSMVCYCLGVTSVDPGRMDLLFERFISRERNEAPDIDVDFEHQRREEVLQYLYEKYGRERAGMTATVTTYRAKSAVRETGKALGASADAIERMAKMAESFSKASELEERSQQAGVDPRSDLGRRWQYLVSNLMGFPRHLSQHVGGMVMTSGPLCELCPIENAAMEGRTVIQWDKDDLDELGILKVDCLSLGMLSALHRCFDLVSQHHGRQLTLSTVPPSDTDTYDMICRADTIGVFQIESRAQMSMLPRLRPRCFYDLVIEVAIVRPGPIQGNMVHPYLKARDDASIVVYPNEDIKRVLEKTLGVPIFQEQAMRLAVVAAGFTPGEADQLRRAMAAWRRPGVIDRFRTKLLEGMQTRGLTGEFAEQVFHQIRGFGEYGFPESHAASFALLVYASCYLKCHYPAAFCAALLNSQPMGFYAPAQLVADAQAHGVEVRGQDINISHWDSILEPAGVAAAKGANAMALRLGLQLIRGLPTSDAHRILSERQQGGAFRSVADLTRRANLGQSVLSILADAGTFESLSGDRRSALWETLGQDRKILDMPLLGGLDNDEELMMGAELLDTMSPLEEVYADYNATGLSLRGHPLQFCRDELKQLRCVTAAELPGLRHGRAVRVAGLVLLRQRPGTAKGITFVTLEDETGSMNLILHPGTWKTFFTIARTSNAWMVRGKLENRKGVIHIVVGHLEDLTDVVDGLDVRSRDFR
jgi:error-prone DNA polymerase